MTAATQDLGSKQRIGTFYELPPKAATTHYIGTLAGDKAGEALPVVADVLIKRIGVVEAIGGPQGAPTRIKVCVDPTKIFGPFANSTAGDALAEADVGAIVYGVDNQTLAKTDGSATRPAVGYLHSVTAEGVFFTKVKY